MKLCRGFTLFELMVTVAVLAILVTVGVPSFRDLIQNNRVTAQTNELVTALNFARTEAVKRGRNVQVAVAQANQGWTATVALANSGGAADLRVVDRQGSTITVNTGTIVFNSNGVPNVTETFGMQPFGCTGEKRREIVVAPSGQVTTTRQGCQ